MFFIVTSITGGNIFDYLHLTHVFPSATRVVVKSCKVQAIDAFIMFDKLMKTRKF
jgi:hypothetical protein